jgi:hypothetical protein
VTARRTAAGFHGGPRPALSQVRAAFGWVSAGDGDDRVDCEREVHPVAVSVSAGVFVDPET